MTNWKEIHLDFTEELKREWIEWFKKNREEDAYQSANNWIAVGLEPTESRFAKWLENKGYIPNEEPSEEETLWGKREERQKLFQLIDKETLKQEYLNDTWASTIHPDFAKKWGNKTCQQHWEEQDFTYQQAKQWVSVGFKPDDSYKVGKWKKYNFTPQEAKSWKDIGLANYDAEFVACLRWKGYEPSLDLDWKQLKKDGTPAQDYLDAIYPKEQRSTIKKIKIHPYSDSGWNCFTGSADLRDFVNLEELNCQNDKLTELNLNNCLKLKKLDCRGKLTELKTNHLTNLTELDCRENQLVSLELSNCSQLKKLDCSSNQLTKLDLSNCEQLGEVNCSNNLLTNITLPSNFTNLKTLNLGSNNFSAQDLSFLVPYFNLQKLELRNGSKYYLSLPGKEEEKINQGIYNRFMGSLDYLSEMKQLKELDISETDINEVQIDKLPRSLRWIECWTSKKPDCKLVAIVPQLKKFNKYGWCYNCKQFNISEKWCQRCAKKEWENLSGQELIEKFIEQQKSRDESKKLWWIPYDHFTNIEYLAQGGFSKIYKAKWEKANEYSRWLSNDVVLKILSSSQNITSEFLTEITNTKLLEDVGNASSSGAAVRCYGISQDPITKNYVMVMQYIEGGNLRQVLQKNGTNDRELSLERRIDALWRIALGLERIHNQGLVHRDFHSGNILRWDNITDLGLSQPANYQKEEGEIFGVLPYVAPEVLRRKPYTQASDIYSFGILAYEWLANSYPYNEKYSEGWNKVKLSTEICQGLRPEIDKIPIPQSLKDLIKRCWDIDPKKRPHVRELTELSSSYRFLRMEQEYNEKYNAFSRNTPYQIHPNIVTHSKMINTKQINELLKNLQPTEAISSQLTKITDQIKELEEKIKTLKEPLNSELVGLLDQFIEMKKKSLREEVVELERKVREKGLSRKERDKFIRYCEDLIKLENQKQQLESEQFQAQVEIKLK